MTLILTIECICTSEAGVSNILSNKGSLHCLYNNQLLLPLTSIHKYTLLKYCKVNDY